MPSADEKFLLLARCDGVRIGSYDGRRREENEVSLPPTQRGAVTAAYRIECRGERAGDPQCGSRRAGRGAGAGHGRERALLGLTS